MNNIIWEKASIGCSGLGDPKHLWDRDQLMEERHRLYADSIPGARIQQVVKSGDFPPQ